MSTSKIACFFINFKISGMVSIKLGMSKHLIISIQSFIVSKWNIVNLSDIGFSRSRRLGTSASASLIKKNVATFYKYGSSAYRHIHIDSLGGDSLLSTAKYYGVPSSHLIDIAIG